MCPKTDPENLPFLTVFLTVFKSGPRRLAFGEQSIPGDQNSELFGHLPVTDPVAIVPRRVNQIT
jgi:hypothetical protein